MATSRPSASLLPALDPLQLRDSEVQRGEEAIHLRRNTQALQPDQHGHRRPEPADPVHRQLPADRGDALPAALHHRQAAPVPRKAGEARSLLHQELLPRAVLVAAEGPHLQLRLCPHSGHTAHGHGGHRRRKDLAQRDRDKERELV